MRSVEACCASADRAGPMKREGRRWRVERHDASACETSVVAMHEAGSAPSNGGRRSSDPIETPQTALVLTLGPSTTFAFPAFPSRLYGLRKTFRYFASALPLKRTRSGWTRHNICCFVRDHVRAEHAHRTEIARQIDSGKLTAEAVIRAHLERIDSRDADVLAWSHLAARLPCNAQRCSIAGHARACCTACRWA